MVYLEESLCNAPMNLNVVKFNDSYQCEDEDLKKNRCRCGIVKTNIRKMEVGSIATESIKT